MLILNRQFHYAMDKLGVDMDEELRYMIVGDVVHSNDVCNVGHGCNVYINGECFPLIPLLEGVM